MKMIAVAVLTVVGYLLSVLFAYGIVQLGAKIYRIISKRFDKNPEPPGGEEALATDINVGRKGGGEDV